MSSLPTTDLRRAHADPIPRRALDAHSYVPVHLEYILTEILKNSFRATVEWHQRHHSYSSPVPVPPVLITIASPSRSSTPARLRTHVPHAHARAPHFLFMRIRDQGGGVPPANMSRIFSYSFTTAGRGASAHAAAAGDADADEDMGLAGGPYAAQHMSGAGAGAGEGLFAEMTGRGVQTGMGTIAGLGYGLPMSRLYAKYFGGSLTFKSLDGWGACCFVRASVLRMCF